MRDDTENCSVLGVNDFPSPEAYALWARTMIGIYNTAAENKIARAEKLIAAGISLREQVMEALDRAEDIARSLAKVVDSGMLSKEHAEDEGPISWA